MAKLTIDGREIEVPDGTSLFDACREARDGEELPHFCYHPDLSIAGVCRLCQVEVEGMPKLTIACNTSVRDGMVVHTRSEKVTKASRQILEMHLINHPVDCPICDQAGECGLQDQYMGHGLYEAKVDIEAKVNKGKAEVIGPHVILDQERCVLCSRCVRFCDEVTGTGELGIFNRGDRAEIGTAPGVELDNNYSLNTVDICPVGALTSRDFRFQKRVWMLKAASSVCPGCATGCNVRIDHEAGRIYRLKPRYNPEVNGRWMCDLGRLTYQAVHTEGRLADPVTGDRTGPWSGVAGAVADLGAKDGFGLVLGSPHQSLEEMHLWRAVAGDAPVHGGLQDAGRGMGDDLLLDADRTPNRGGLSLLGIATSDGSALAATISGTTGVILIHGGDPAADQTVAAALNGRSVVYLGTAANATSALAAVVLPGAMWAEKAGIFVNKDGRLQEFQQGVARHGNAREDWRILAELMSVTGAAEPPGSLKAVRADLGAAVGGADLNKLPARGFVAGGDAG